MRYLKGIGLGAFAVFIACGGSSAGGGAVHVDGNIDGAPVEATEAIALVGPLVDTFGHFTTPGVAISVSNLAGQCAAGATVPGTKSLELIVGSPKTVAPGTYSISTQFSPMANNAIAAYQAVDAQCHSTSAHGSRAGSITLERIDAQTVSGSFDVTLDSGERLTGTFSAPVCNVVDDAGPTDTGHHC